MKALFLIRSLDLGGAERQLVALANGLAGRGHEVHLAVFYSGGALEEDLEGVIRHDLAKGGRWDIPGFLLRLIRLIRTLRPDLCHGYLGTANLLLALLKPALRGCPVFWGVRASNMDLGQYSLLHRLHWKAEALLSGSADAIIYNSTAGREHAEECGFQSLRGHVIPNGIDTDRFRPDPEGGLAFRRAWRIPEHTLLIGLPARLDPMKDHRTFLKAAALLAKQHDDLHFVCIGEGPLRAELEEDADAFGLVERLVWTGLCHDMPAAYSAMDICCLSSAFGEGFPNVLGEAMACGVVCVATDVGDSPLLIAREESVVPPGSPDSLAQALGPLLALPAAQRAQLGSTSRARIKSDYSLEAMVASTETLLTSSP